MSRPSSEAKKAMTLAEELTLVLREIPVRKGVWFDAPAKTLGDEHWRMRLHGIIEEIAVLESELAKRRVRDAEIAKRLSAWIDGVELAASTKSYLGDLFNILYDLKTDPVPKEQGEVR